MRAVEIVEPGGPRVLQPCERPIPVPRPSEILIEVKAAGINRPDVIQREGRYPPPKGASDLPGLEVSGVVKVAGAETKRFRPGDKVCALTNGGGYAQFVAVDEGAVLPVPTGFTLTQAAAVPENHFTVWHNVFQRGGLKEAETFLLHGGTSGIGTTAIQLAKALGATVFATAGTDEKCDLCRMLGADLAINYRTQDFVAAVKSATDGAGANVILDMVGGDYIPRNHSAAAVDGRIVQIAFLQGARVEVDFTKVMVKRLVHTGSTLRPRSTKFKAELATELERQVWPLLNSGKVTPIMDMIFPLDEAWRAHERMESGDHIGKIMLDVG
ncbi:MAG: NAD(P)H-quinone oxidoreductase [Pseudomonadota bacterium]